MAGWVRAVCALGGLLDVFLVGFVVSRVWRFEGSLRDKRVGAAAATANAAAMETPTTVSATAGATDATEGCCIPDYCCSAIQLLSSLGSLCYCYCDVLLLLLLLPLLLILLFLLATAIAAASAATVTITLVGTATALAAPMTATTATTTNYCTTATIPSSLLLLLLPEQDRASVDEL